MRGRVRGGGLMKGWTPAACLAACLVACLAAGTAWAREVQVTQDIEAGGPIQAVDLALKQAFVQAVVQEAQDMLGEPQGPDRQRLLQEALSAKAPNLITSYAETSRETKDKTVTLALDVTVDRSGLRSTLQSMGLMQASRETARSTGPGGQSGQVGPAGLVRVTVQGWRALEGVAETDQVLAGIDRSAKLEQVSVRPEALQARWLVRTSDAEGLRNQLGSALTSRGLTFSLGPAD